MPLFNYKCNKCEQVTERFQHQPDSSQVECRSCGHDECTRVLNIIYNRTWLNARDNLSQRITPEVDRISDKISKGSANDFLDIHGEK